MIPYATCPCRAKEQDIDTYFIAKGASVPYSDWASFVPTLESHEDSLSQKCLILCPSSEPLVFIPDSSRTALSNELSGELHRTSGGKK